jgi:flagellar protein FlaG
MGRPAGIIIWQQVEKWGDTMFEAIQNTYSKVQENEPVFTNVVPLKPSPTPVEQQQQQTQTQSQKQKAQVAAEPEVAQDLLDQLAEDIGIMHSVYLQFSVQEKSGRTIIKVMDKTNSEVIREIPSKTVQALASKIDEVLGLLFDKKV